ncbi:MAG: ATPase [Theionarchaea archaeon]|nr:ATPase [Theionarchaea archaeon]
MSQLPLERAKTGIPGLDEIIGGGYPQGTTILVCGGSGTGKTIFCTQFLHSGIIEQNEPGIFVTLEERPSDLREEMLSLGWDLAEHERNDDLIIIDGASLKTLMSPCEYALSEGFNVDNLVFEIYKGARKINAKRLVIDSLPGLELRFGELSEFRKALSRLSFMLLELGITSLMTTESVDPSLVSRYGIEEFVVRGVIILSLEEEGFQLKRFLRVRKMRGTMHSLKSIPFEITEKGAVLYLVK